MSKFDNEEWGRDNWRPELEAVAALIRDVLDDPAVAAIKSGHLDRMCDWLSDNFELVRAFDAKKAATETE